MTWRRLSHVADVSVSTVDKHTVEGEVPVRLCNYVDVYKNHEIVDGLDFMTATATPDEIRRFSIAHGDTLFTKDSETADDIGVPAYVRTRTQLVCGYHVAIARQRERAIHPRYLFWSLASSAAAQQWRVLATGVTRVGLRHSDIGKLSIWVPDLQEQCVIAGFLDRETAKIDALIAKQDALLAALDEHRAAVISSAAPKSFAALGWPLDKLGRRTRIGNGSTPSRENLDYWEGGATPWMNSSVVNQASAKEPSALVTDLALAQCHLPLVKAGSLLVGLTGQGKTRGMATLTELNTTINQHLAFVEPSERHWVPRFLLWQLRASYGELRRVSDENGSTKGGLTCGDLASLKVAMPPLQLQTFIADKIDRETAGIDAVVGKVGVLTGRLRERRAALITAAVTGRLDVTTYGKAG